MVIFRIELHVRILSHAGQVLAARGDAMGSNALVRPKNQVLHVVFRLGKSL